jgi:hypothetical protein
MKTIWKYELALVDGAQEVTAPWPFRVVNFDMQRGVPCVWAHVHSSLGRVVHREFYIVGTGHQLPDGADYYHGTAMHHALQDDFVWHLYEDTTKSDVSDAGAT